MTERHTAVPFPDWYIEIRSRVLRFEALHGRNPVVSDFIRLFQGYEELWIDQHGELAIPPPSLVTQVETERPDTSDQP